MIIVDHEKNGYQNLEKLTDIVNPIAWQTRLDGNIYAHTLIAGLRKEKLPMLQRYVNWGLKRVKHTPRSSIYSNILLSLDKLQQKLEYHRVLLEAKKTYPLIKKWGENTSIADVD
jgi:O-antigen polymerase